MKLSENKLQENKACYRMIYFIRKLNISSHLAQGNFPLPSGAVSTKCC